MSQQDRVLAALSRAGARGITQVDFLLPDVIDGGPPITRLPARIKELRDAGLPVRNGGIRDKCRVFRLLTAMYAIDAETGCWNWGGTRNPVTGYGMLDNAYAHRLIYEHEIGPIGVDLELDHLCRNRACVNPDHLEPVAHAENVQRGAVAKLDPDDVELIRASTESTEDLARRYGVARTTIWRIRRGSGWGGERAADVIHNAEKTHCKRGHEFTPDNIYSPPGRPEVRTCRACRTLAGRKRRDDKLRASGSAAHDGTEGTGKPGASPSPEPSGVLFETRPANHMWSARDAA
jgi:hypothetical protein